MDLRPPLVAESRGTVLLDLAYVPCLPAQKLYSSRCADFLLPRAGRAYPDVSSGPELAEIFTLNLVLASRSLPYGLPDGLDVA